VKTYPSVPPNTRIYAIGDVHGRADLLEQLLQLIHKDAQPFTNHHKMLICLGDYIDRGPNSDKVIDVLIAPPLPDSTFVYLKGNHEDMLLNFLINDDLTMGYTWLNNGGIATLKCYGIEVDDDMGILNLSEIQYQLQQKLPKSHINFFQSLKLSYTSGDYFFVHGGVNPDKSLREQSAKDLLWIRDKFLLSNVDFGKVVVHGHTIAEKPQIKNNQIGIDTGAFYSGVLTCLVLGDGEKSFLRAISSK